jgi:hypothetical protein
MFSRRKKSPHDRGKKQVGRTPTVDNYATCAFCGITFNYRYQGTITLAGEEFCTDECARKNYLKSVRERDEPIPFDAL